MSRIFSRNFPLNSMIEKRKLGDLEISPVITGLWQIADMEKDGEVIDIDKAARAMVPYMDAGLTTFDMADHYGSAELIAGAYYESNPGSGQWLTKWVPRPGSLTKNDVREAIEKALGRLKSESIDLLQYHAWNYADASYLDQLGWLQELRDKGMIRNLGLTNFDSAHLRIVKKSGIDVVSNQVCYSLLDQRARFHMVATCRELDVKILAFGTVAGGFLSEKWLNKPEPRWEEIDSWSLMKYKRFIDSAGGWEVYQNMLKTVKDVADSYRVSVANIATKFIMSQPEVGGVIVGARLGHSEHVTDNLNLFNFSLSDEDNRAIDDALSDLSAIPGDCGDEYRKPPFLTASGDLSHHLDEMPKPFTPVEGPHGTRVLSGSSWEDEFGYCRAVRSGNRIVVSGTTASHGDQLIGGSDPGAQAEFVIDKIEGALQSLGAALSNVIRTRVYIQKMDHWEQIAKVHGRRFRDIKPANTLVQAGLIGDEYLVEIEAEAEVAN